mmetsp:Transcript_43012/g.102981  ORF Transcript_43012/g.102981 Transcript_43012/m.102981 type:complete len:629 (+) Transcript_43012:46-1932(+)
MRLSSRDVLSRLVTNGWLALTGAKKAPDAEASPSSTEPSTAPDAVLPEPEPEGPVRQADETVVTMTQLVLPSDSSKEGTLLAGPLLKWIDICACMSAERFSGTNCVTASMEDIHFIQQVRVGEVVKLTGRVQQAWKTSMEVAVEVTIDRLGERNADPVICCHAMSTFVSKDKKVLPKLEFSTMEQKGCAEQANARKAMRAKVPKKQGQDGRPPIAEGTTVSTELVMPHHCQHMGTTFGGWIMQWMECTSSIAAARHTRLPMMCVSTDIVNFLAPSHAGHAVELRAVVSCVWNTSLEVGCWASAEDLREGTSKPICQMYATYTTSGQAAAILPPLRSGDGAEAPRSPEAYQRRAARLQRKALAHSGGLSMDAAAFDEHAARSAVRDLQALACSRGPDDAGKSSEALAWETLFDGEKLGLPVLVEVVEDPNTCLRITFSLGAAPKTVHEAVNDFEDRKSWDAMIAGAEPLPPPAPGGQARPSSFQAEWPVELDMLRVLLSSGHDVILARARMAVEEQAVGKTNYISVSRSIRHPDAPPREGTKRIELNQAGWLLRPDGQGGCKVVYALHLGASALGMMLSNADGTMLSSMDLSSHLLHAKENGLEGSGGVLFTAIRSVVSLMAKFPPKKP